MWQQHCEAPVRKNSPPRTLSLDRQIPNFITKKDIGNPLCYFIMDLVKMMMLLFSEWWAVLEMRQTTSNQKEDTDDL